MITLENKFFSLRISEDCKATGLLSKKTGEECLIPGKEMPLFSLTQERPYNNEIKLIYPNKRTTFNANRIRKEDNKLIVGFELVAFEAVIKAEIKDSYIAFELEDILIPEGTYGVGCRVINPAPVYEFKLLQLPVAKREKFGQWLNVVWDEKTAVNILSTSPYALIDAEYRDDYYLMHATASKDVRINGCGAALIVSPSDELLDCIQNVEEDFGLPSGVKNRRSDSIDQSLYWTCDITPENADEHIRLAKNGGFSRMLIYIIGLLEGRGYHTLGNYKFTDSFPNGLDDLKALLDKIKAAGITPGIHFLHSHIGVESKYVTPVADHRLNLTRHFTLSKPLALDDDEIYVEQNPQGSPLTPAFQVLKFDGEVISYDSYTTEYPYCFRGCKRGHFNTNITSHNMGTIGGVLDVSEFGACSVYIDERTNLQDEIAEKIAKIYNTGFEFIYFDGSEGTNPPFEFNVPYAQHRVYKRLEKEPLFCEGAAKSHFGWHMLSGGNAFDVFPAEVFKDKIVEFPLCAAPIMANNFTRINFGWWAFGEETQPDMYEFGVSKAASYNCATTVMVHLELIANSARAEDNLEVMHRWEDAKRKKWLSDKHKEMLKNPDQEYILLVNESGEYELVPYFQIKKAANGNKLLKAFYFEREGKTYVVCWHTQGKGNLFIPLENESLTYENQLGENDISFERTDNGIILPIEGRRYLSAHTSKEEFIKAFENADILD